MKKQTMFTVLISILLIGTGFADDFNPPPWRGGPLSIEAQWDFEGGIISSYPPDYYMTVGGSHGEVLSGYWTHIDGTGAYVPDPDGAGPKGGGAAYTGFVIHLDNWIDVLPYKDIRLQLTGYMSTGGEVPFFQDPQFDITAVPLDGWMLMESGIEYNGIEDITRAWYDIRIWPNPDREDIWFNTVPPGVIIDQVYVDTISIPEPTTFVLLSLGGLLLRKFKS